MDIRKALYQSIRKIRNYKVFQFYGCIQLIVSGERINIYEDGTVTLLQWGTNTEVKQNSEHRELALEVYDFYKRKINNKRSYSEELERMKRMRNEANYINSLTGVYNTNGIKIQL